MITGYTGISFPFRIGNSGGVSLSTTSPDSVPHIMESIAQILLTRPFERVMEYFFYSEVPNLLFELNNQSLQTLMAYYILDAITRLEPRVELKQEDIKFSVEDNVLFTSIHFKVKSYNTYYNEKIKIGEV